METIVAHKSGYPASPAVDRDWRAESDSSTLVSAAEIIGDRLRLKSAMTCFDHKMVGMGRMEKMLTGLRLGRSRGGARKRGY
jgi:hypothetical protein